jgi:hypothetical protein
VKSRYLELEGTEKKVRDNRVFEISEFNNFQGFFLLKRFHDAAAAYHKIVWKLHIEMKIYVHIYLYCSKETISSA